MNSRIAVCVCVCAVRNTRFPNRKTNCVCSTNSHKIWDCVLFSSVSCILRLKRLCVCMSRRLWSLRRLNTTIEQHCGLGEENRFYFIFCFLWGFRHPTILLVCQSATQLHSANRSDCFSSATRSDKEQKAQMFFILFFCVLPFSCFFSPNVNVISKSKC